jgi:hypothetical protein
MGTNPNSGITAANVIALGGGLILLIVSILNVAWFGSGAPNWGGYGGYMQGAMGGYHNFMGSYAASTSFFATISVVSLMCGVIVVIMAILLRARPQEHVIWGALIVAFSVVSFAGMGGYFVGAVLGIVGGALALTYRP